MLDAALSFLGGFLGCVTAAVLQNLLLRKSGRSVAATLVSLLGGEGERAAIVKPQAASVLHAIFPSDADSDAEGDVQFVGGAEGSGRDG